MLRKYSHPETVIKLHNFDVNNLVENTKVMKIDLTYLFMFLNRMLFADQIINTNIIWFNRYTANKAGITSVNVRLKSFKFYRYSITHALS